MAIRVRAADLPAAVPGTTEQLRQIHKVLVDGAQLASCLQAQLWAEVQFFAHHFLEILKRSVSSPRLAAEIGKLERVEHLAVQLYAAIHDMDDVVRDEMQRRLRLITDFREIMDVDVINKKFVHRETPVGGRLAAELTNLIFARGQHPLEFLAQQAREKRRSLGLSDSRTGPGRLHDRLAVEPRSWLASTVADWLRRAKWSPRDHGAAGRLLEAMGLLFEYSTGLAPDELQGAGQKASADLARYRDAEMQASHLIEQQAALPFDVWDGRGPEWRRLQQEIESLRSGAGRRRARNSAKNVRDCE